ncbi:ferritin, heavy subunit-like [Trichechus manatus latirostris]|uniref:Ferritin n=1 Tax=Trichechus manatus latirostris TaxID=127582 RepID=A0A2Y9G5E2_TRIMA|nr:ferritin, heavy subunit-like [Trichechus manatus latirostris]
MEPQVQRPLPEDCQIAINQVASYELHISDAYSSMACYYNEEMGIPPFAKFFREQADVKREHAKQLLRYLRKHEGIVCLPVIKRPDIDNRGSGIQALESALQLENMLSKALQNLKILVCEKSEINLSGFVREFLDKQMKNIEYLEYHLVYQKELEELVQQEALFVKPAAKSDE